jgi:Ni,Fe-hydrogenase III small subunit
MTVKVAPEFWVNQGPATDVEANKLRTTAAAFRRMADGLLGARQGVVFTRGSCQDLKVMASAVPDVNITIRAGACFVSGTQVADQGMYHVYNDADMVIPLLTNNPANASNPRYDVVVARLQDQQYSGVTDLPTIEMVTGTPAASPVVPAVPTNCLILANVLVPAASTTVTQANITDRRVPAGNQPVVLEDIVVGIDARYPAATAQVDLLNTSGSGINLLPPGFAAWEIWYQGRSDQAAFQNLGMRLNNDVAANSYAYQRVYFQATGVPASEQLNSSSSWVGYLPSTATFNLSPGQSKIWIPNPSGQTFRKMYRSDWSSFITSGFGVTNQIQGDVIDHMWVSTAAITRLSFFPTAGKLIAGSRFTLIGHPGIQP